MIAKLFDRLWKKSALMALEDVDGARSQNRALVAQVVDNARAVIQGRTLAVGDRLSEHRRNVRRFK